MLWALALILIVIWLLTVLMLKTVGALIHIVLALGIVLMLIAFLRGRGLSGGRAG
jgi:hypothetical protein